MKDFLKTYYSKFTILDVRCMRLVGTPGAGNIVLQFIGFTPVDHERSKISRSNDPYVR